MLLQPGFYRPNDAIALMPLTHTESQGTDARACTTNQAGTLNV